MSGPVPEPARHSDAARAVQESGLLTDGARLLVACSGGADSVGLLLALAQHARSGAIELSAAHVHHGLRPGEADADAARVSELCEALDVPLAVLRRDAAEARRLRRRGPEDAARAVRREALEQAADEAGCEFIALAHTRDDQAETLLLHLLRGSGPDGLAGMRPRSGRYLRPLLHVRRATVRSWLARAGVPWVSDRTNWCDTSARALLRPLLGRAAELFNESLVDRLGALAELFAEDAELLEGLAAVERERLEGPGASDLRGGGRSRSLAAGPEGLAGLPKALGRRVARGFLRELDPAGLPPRADAVERLLRLAADDPGSERTAHVRGPVLRRIGSRVVAGGAPAEPPPPPPAELPVDGELRWGERGLVTARRVEPAEARRIASKEPAGRRVLLDGDRLPARLLVRCRRPGDRHHPVGSPSERSLAAWMRDTGVSRPERARLPLVVDAEADGCILWAAGGPPREGWAASRSSRTVLVLEWRPDGAAGELQ